MSQVCLGISCNKPSKCDAFYASRCLMKSDDDDFTLRSMLSWRHALSCPSPSATATTKDMHHAFQVSTVLDKLARIESIFAYGTAAP